MKDFVKEKKSILIVICVMFIITISAFITKNFSHAQEEYPLLSTNYGNTIFNLVENQGINTNSIYSINFIKITDNNLLNNTNIAYFKSLDNQIIKSWANNNTLYFGTENDSFEVGPNMGFAFSNLNNITSINLSSMNTSKVVNMSAMFQHTGKTNDNLTVDLGEKFDTSNVTDMSSMFELLGYASKNFTLNLGNKFNTANVTNMANMFYATTVEYEDDSELNLGNLFNTSNVIDMSGMFGYITLNNFNLGLHFNTANVTNMSSMFYSGNVKKINIGNEFNTSKVTNMSHMFMSFRTTENFKDVLGNKFNTANVTDMSGMFSGAFAFSSNDVDVSMFNIVNIKNMDKMFERAQIMNIKFGNGWDYAEKLPTKNLFNNSYIKYVYNAPDAIKNYNWTADGLNPTFYPTTSIENAKVTVSNTTYDGNVQKPSISVTIDNEMLSEDFQYIVNYGNYINAGIGKIVIEGSEKYFGTITKNFTINKRNVTLKAKNQVGNELVKNVNQITTSNLVNGHKIESIDFTLDEKAIIINNAKIVDANNIEVTNNYNITYDYGFLGDNGILMQHISNQNIVIPNTSFIYTGDFIEPEVNVYDRMGNVDLLPGSEFSVEYKNNQNVGTAEIIIKGKASYTGTAVRNFEITKRNITIDPKDQIGTTLDESLDQVTVTNLAPNHRLESIDFTLSNSSITLSNPKIVDANGNDVTSNYEIMYSIGKLEKKYIGKETINIESNLTYTGQEIKPHVTIVGLEENVDFEVKYSDNINPGVGSIYITGLGEYTGTILRTFTIGFKPISIKAKNQSLLKNEELKNGDNYIEVNGLNIGHKVTVELIKEENNIIIKNVNIKDKDQNNVTGFYDVTLEKGTIKYVDYAIDSDDLYIDDVEYTISYLSIGNTLNDIKSLLNGTKIKSYTLTNKSKEEKTTTIATGDYLKVKYDDNTEHFYALSVNGDVSGDAKIELDDIMKIAKQLYTTQNELKGVYLTAADYDNDDNLTLADLMKVAKTVYLSK